MESTGVMPEPAAIATWVRRAPGVTAAVNRPAGVIKDNTLLPGEWYGGQLHLQPLVADEGRAKTYQIAVQVGGDRHEIDIAQGGQ